VNLLSPRIHATVDYLSVLLLVLAPTLFGLNDIATRGAYALAAIHLVMTLLTDFPGGVMKLLPLRVHGMVEIVVGVLLVLAPLVIPAATVLVVVWGITDYVRVHPELHDDIHTEA
jgi:hypothetical protein